MKSGSISGVDDADGIPKPNIQEQESDETQPEPQAQPQSFEGNTP